MSTPSSSEAAPATGRWLWSLVLLLVMCGGVLQAASWGSWPPSAALAGCAVSCALLGCLALLWRSHRRVHAQLAEQVAESLRLHQRYTASGNEHDRRWREWARSYDESLRGCLRDFAPELRAVLAEGAQGEVPKEAPEWLRAELGVLLDLAGEIEDDHQDAYEHILVTLGSRMQSAALRLEEKARLGLYDHRDPAVRTIGMEITHEANQLVHITSGVRVLAGEWAGQQWPDPIAASEIVQAASGRIAEYKRVRVHGDPDLGVAAHAAEYVIHVIAELLQNAAAYSPPGYTVHAWVDQDQDGLVIQVDDQGLGMTEARLEDMREIASGNRPLTVRTLAGPQIGLAVVGNIARRFDLDVYLDRSRYKGLRAMVHVPAEFVEPVTELLYGPGTWPEQGAPALDAPIATAAAHPAVRRPRSVEAGADSETVRAAEDVQDGRPNKRVGTAVAEAAQPRAAEEGRPPLPTRRGEPSAAEPPGFRSAESAQPAAQRGALAESPYAAPSPSSAQAPAPVRASATEPTIVPQRSAEPELGAYGGGSYDGDSYDDEAPWSGERTASGRLPKRRSTLGGSPPGAFDAPNGAEYPGLEPAADLVERDAGEEQSAQEAGAWLGAFIAAGSAPYGDQPDSAEPPSGPVDGGPPGELPGGAGGLAAQPTPGNEAGGAAVLPPGARERASSPEPPEAADASASDESDDRRTTRG